MELWNRNPKTINFRWLVRFEIVLTMALLGSSMTFLDRSSGILFADESPATDRTSAKAPNLSSSRTKLLAQAGTATKLENRPGKQGAKPSASKAPSSNTAPSKTALPGGETGSKASPSVGNRVDPVVQKRLLEFGKSIEKAEREDPIAESNNLKQILLALHNFHDTVNHFPALNGVGEKDFPHPGLSWRVYLLPYLEQGALYGEFHHDEPWDSEHNKTLIAKMPKIYGVNAEGKTRVHVFAGEGAPMRNDGGLGFKDILDGTSNTIFCVAAGADKADVWTKPGGLEVDLKNPLKCLGNVGESFSVGMLDGSVRRLAKSTPAAELAKLIQHADGQPLEVVAANTRQTDDPFSPSFKVVDPVTPLGPVSPQLDLSYIPNDTFAAFVIHPRRFYSHPFIKSVREQMGPDFWNGTLLNSPWGRSVGGGTAEMCRMFGIVPQNIDEVVVILDKSLPGAGVNGFVGGAPLFGVLIRNSAPIDIDRALKGLTLHVPTEVQQYDGVSMLVSVRDQVCICFVNDFQVIVGHLEFVKKMVAARTEVAAKTALSKRLQSAGNQLIVLAVDAQEIEDEIKGGVQQLPLPISLFSPYFLGAKELMIAIDLDAPQLLQSELQFKKVELATGLFSLLDVQWQSFKEDYPNSKQAFFSNPSLAPLQPFVDQLVTDSTFKQQGDTIHLVVPVIKNQEQFLTMLKPALESTRKVAEASQRRNVLKQIGLAFHNYHDTFNQFPATNGPGVTGRPHPGLSWRVYLLPYLDQAPLYNQFKMDEPWDSEHNKTLIAKMPKMFGSNPEGKTSLHVFTGTGAPFQPDEGIKLSHVTDGLSNTLLAIDGGDDVAEIWTKPGGLEFDPDMPLKCLGQIKEFSAVMMDGAVRRFKELDQTVFQRLVQHRDGEPVTVP